jgi:hypothetical protein
MTLVEIDWSAIKRGRESTRGMFPRVLKVPIIEDARQKVCDLLPEGGSILDVGAYDRNLETYLKKAGKAAQYKSYDPDRALRHDYYNLDEIHETFDVIVVFEVIEHLSVGEVIELMTRLRHFLKEQAILVVSTPNVFHPTIFWRDCTHRTGFRYNEVVGLMQSVGYRAFEVYRVARRSLKDRIAIFFYKPLIKLLNMDFAGRILVICRK